jgi:hypothetical protein
VVRVFLKFMKISILAAFLFLQVLSLQSQSLQGFYTGQLRLAGTGAKLNAQLDLMEDSGRYSAVLRSRVVEDLAVSGCDNWLEGKMNGSRMEMVNMTPLRATNVPQNACIAYKFVKLNVKQENGEYQLTGNVNEDNGMLYGKLTLTRVDTAISFSVEEEAVEAKRKMGEILIAAGRTDQEVISRMLAVRGVEFVDTISIPAVGASLKVEAPDADIFHRLTVMVNDKVALLAATPRQQGAVIRLKEMAPGDVEILLLCYHVMVDVDFDVKLTLTWEGSEKIWTLPVSTLRNRGIVIRVKEPGS